MRAAPGRHDMKLRPYQDADLPAVLGVWYRASLIAHSFLPADFFETERVSIAQEWMPIADTTVAEVDGRVVGFLSLIGDEVGAIFVDPAQQGTGVGRALLDNARAVRMHLELDVFEENEIGRRFYERAGFRQVGRSVDDVTGRPQLRLRLG